MMTILPVLYLAAIIGIGLSHRRGLDTQSGYFLARRSGNIVLVTGSLLATTLGAFGVMGVSGMAAQRGLVAGWYIWGGVAGMLFLGMWAYRRLDVGNAFTLPELLGVGYGVGVRRLSAALIVLAWLGIIAAQVTAAGKIVHFLGTESGLWRAAPLAEVICIIAVAAAFIAYTWLGGQHSVLRTDVAQATVILVALALFVAMAFARRPDVLHGVPADFLRLPFNNTMSAAQWMIVILTFGVPFMVGPDIYSRLFSGRDESTARRAAIAAGLLMIPVFLLVAMAGVVGAGVLGGAGADRDTVLLDASRLVLPPVWQGLLIAALLAAIMSSADTTLLTVSTLVGRDLLGTMGLQPREERRAVSQGRWIVVVAGVLSVAVALWWRDIVAALSACYTLYSPSVLVPFLVFLFWRRHRFHPASGVIAVALGAIFAVLSMLLDRGTLMATAFAAPAIPLAIDLIRRGKY